MGINLLVGCTFGTSVRITAICRNRCVLACMCAHVIEIEGDEHPFEPSTHTSPQWTGECSTRCGSMRCGEADRQEHVTGENIELNILSL